MAEVLTASVEQPTPSLPQWLKGSPRRPLAAVLAVATAAFVWTIGSRIDDVIADGPLIEVETTYRKDLPREWRWQRETASFDSMYGARR